jgi:hypothetical protein
MAPKPIVTTSFINPVNHPCVSVCVSLIVAGQRLGKIVTAATNTHSTTEELLGMSFSIRSVSYQSKLGY